MSAAFRPDFIVIGAAKSGTTSLCAVLGQHPDVCISRPKEPQFFSTTRNYQRGWDHYRTFFQHCRPGMLIGEGSANYTMLPKYPETAARIARHLPGARLLYIVRHPIDRIISNWKMLYHRFPNIPLFMDAVKDPGLRHQLVERSRYWYQLQAYRSCFPDSQIQVLLFRQLVQNTQNTYRKCAEFLGFSPDHHVEMKRAYNRGVYGLRETKRSRRLKSSLALQIFRNFIPGRARGYMARLVMDKAVARPECDRRTLAWILDQIQPDSRQLLSFYGFPDSTWDLNLDNNFKKFAHP